MAFDLGPETWTADATGAAVQRVADADPGDEYDVSHYGHYADISPDGNRVVYSTCKYTVFDHDRVGWRYNLGYEIASVNVDGSDRQRLTNNVHFENYPVWSPDGVRIAFIAHNDYNGLADYGYYASPDHYHVQNAQIFTRAADGTDERVVPNTKGGGLYPPVWSPDGQRLAFTAHRGLGTGPGEQFWVYEPLERFLYTVRLDGSELSRIGKATTLPTWSPDGERVAFGLDDGVYTVRYDGTDLREVKVLPDFRPNDVSWSPDGAQLLLASDRGVYVVRPDGSGRRRLGPRGRITAVAWSPDGSMIAASRTDTDRYVGTWTSLVFIMNRDGSDVRTLAEGFLQGDVYKIPRIRAPNPSPLTTASCSAGVVVPDPETNSGLVEDCEALLRTFSALSERGSVYFYASLPITQWEGVDVYGTPPRVRGLSFRERGLKGLLPTELVGLTMLERLDLFRNGLSGPIPRELGNLIWLRSLNLGWNNLTGRIPSELSGMRSIRGVYLRGNSLSGCVPIDLTWPWVEGSELEPCKH